MGSRTVSSWIHQIAKNRRRGVALAVLGLLCLTFTMQNGLSTRLEASTVISSNDFAAFSYSSTLGAPATHSNAEILLVQFDPNVNGYQVGGRAGYCLAVPRNVSAGSLTFDASWWANGYNHPFVSVDGLSHEVWSKTGVTKVSHHSQTVVVNGASSVCFGNAVDTGTTTYPDVRYITVHSYTLMGAQTTTPTPTPDPTSTPTNRSTPTPTPTSHPTSTPTPTVNPTPTAGPTPTPGPTNCTVNLNPATASQINGDLTAGAVVCLAAGSYGSLDLTASPSSNATLTAAPGAHVVTGSVEVSGSHLTVSQLHTTGINVGQGGGAQTNYVVIDHNDAGNTGGYGISIECQNQLVGSTGKMPCGNITISNNKIHNTSTTGEGDALQFQGWHDVTVTGNDIYAIAECPSDTCHTDTLQSYLAQLPTSGLTVTRNYIHDTTNAQGFPFLKDGDISNVTISDNLSVRMAANPQVSGIWVDENIVGLTITKNTYVSTSGSYVKADGSTSNPSLALNHNVFDSLNSTGYAVVDDYNIYTGNNEWTFNIGPHSSMNSNPGYMNPATDDYRLATNPNGIGIDWTPASQQYGPSY
jgi:hypothetical protein